MFMNQVFSFRILETCWKLFFDGVLIMKILFVNSKSFPPSL